MLCIAGKNEVAVRALTAVRGRFEVVALPNPDDGGTDGWQPSLRRAAGLLGVRCVELRDLYAVDKLTFVSLEYANIIVPAKFRSDRLFNLHFSLLPKYRGCNTSVWPILNGERDHGVTLHQIDRGIDTGAIIAQRSFSLGQMTAFDAYMRCQEIGVELFEAWVDRLVFGDVVGIPQGEGSTYPRGALDYGLKEVDLDEPSDAVLRRLRAFSFPPYQRPTIGGREVQTWGKTYFEGATRVPTGDGGLFIRFASASA